MTLAASLSPVPAPTSRRLWTWRRVRVSIVRETATVPYSRPRLLRSGSDVVDMFRAIIADDPREHLLACYLDTKHGPIGTHVVSIGTADSATVHPREIMGPAVSLSAAAFVLCHNHPSGDPTPSAEDRVVTQRLKDVGTLLGIPLLDHVIVGTERYYSFAEEAFFPMPTAKGSA